MNEKKARELTPTPGETKGAESGARRRKKYVKPKITSFSTEELLEQLGSARACSGYNCGFYTP
jgi:hypothetical protein